MNAKQFIIEHVTVGFAAATFLMAVLFWLDVAGLRALVLNTDGGKDQP